jgi:hypothetical protein
MDEQFTKMDLLNILSFIIGVLNYGENLTQGDKQDLMSKFDKQTKQILTELHEHLENQDKQLKEVLERLEVTKNDS